jgi:hypothetical protein
VKSATIVTPVIAPREGPVVNVTGSFQFILQPTVEVAIHEASTIAHACSMTTAALVRPALQNADDCGAIKQSHDRRSLRGKSRGRLPVELIG